MSDSEDDSSGSPIVAKADPFNITDKLNDPIIQKILKDRTVELDENITALDELERQRKMYTWLRNSKKYKKLQVEDANQKEKNSHLLDMKSIVEACDSIKDLHEASTKPSVKSKRIVSFSESKNKIIPPQSNSEFFDSDVEKD